MTGYARGRQPQGLFAHIPVCGSESSGSRRGSRSSSKGSKPPTPTAKSDGKASPRGKDRRAPERAPSNSSLVSGLSSMFSGMSRPHSGHSLHEMDPEHDMKNLHKIQDRAEDKVGILMISGRYHRYPRSLEHDYILTDEVLGTGFNGAVHLAKSKDRPEHKFAVKAFDFTGVPEKRRVQLESEVEVFLCMDHPHIARLVDVYERDYHMDLVMECMEGGELLDRVKERKRFTEADTASHAWQMLLALNYIHSHGMIHCDLKLENFMYDHKEQDDNHLKLIDFGFSKMCDKKAELRRKACGTMSYSPPEVLDNVYSQQSDQWSLGVIVFVLLSGYMPFSGKEDELMKKISTGNYFMRPERWSEISEDAVNFTTCLLQVDPKKRLTADAALRHPFLSKRHFDEETKVDAGIVKSLRDYGRYSRFRRCCLMMMAWSLSSEEREKVEKYFLALDSKHVGAIDYDQLKKVMVDQYHLSSKDAKEAFHALDSAKHKEIHFSDFLAAMIDGNHIVLHEELLHEAFRKFDIGESGHITAEDLRHVLGDTFEGQKVETLLNEADTLHHGQLSFHEFSTYLTGNNFLLPGDEGCGESPVLDPYVRSSQQHRCAGSGQPCCSIQ